MPSFDIAVIVGSLHSGSINRRLARALMRLGPEGFSFAEGNAAYHNGILDDAKFAQAMSELDAQKARL